MHLNEWEPDDFALVAPGGPLAGMTVVHCPLSHRYFGHRRFPVERLRELSVNLCVGTDSQASNGSFSLLDELRVMAAATPALDPGELLAMITLNPARALGLADRLGCLRPGAWADLTALPCPNVEKRNIHAGLLATQTPVSWSMVNGQPL